MQNVSTAYHNAYAQATSLHAKPKVIVEWNHNRFASDVVASNNGAVSTDDIFPIESIAYALRPNSGLLKARCGEAKTANVTTVGAPQYRTVGARSNYKYFTSGHQSASDRSIAIIRPQVVYGAPVMANKIQVTVDVSWSYPQQWEIDVTYDGTNWVQISTGGFIASDGRIVLYLAPGRTTWSQTVTTNVNPIAVRGVRFRPLVMTQSHTHFNIIEISARLERDISDDVISVTTSRTVSEASQVFPVGQMNSNTADITLDNSLEVYDRDNATSMFHNLLDANAEVKIYYGTDVSQYGGSFEYVPQGVYYTDSWNVDLETSQVTLQCTDFSKFFQQIQMYPVLFQDRTPGQIIAEILSGAGFNKYAIDISSTESSPKLPWVWFTNEDTVWDAIQSICASTQSTVYTDETGVMRFVSREAAFKNAGDTPNFTIRAENSGLNKANLQNFTDDFTVEANRVKVKYTPYKPNVRKMWKDRTINPEALASQRITKREYESIPIDSVLWKPEGTVTLRGSELLQSATSTQNWVKIPEADAKTWPYSGYFNVEGEICSYSHKQYRFWKNKQMITRNIKSQEEKDKIDNEEGDLATRHNNFFTGRLEGVKRGLRGTTAAAHNRDLTGWGCYVKRSNNAVDPAPNRMTKQGSEMVLNGASVDDYNTYLHATRGSFSDQYKVYGTRVRFANASYSGGTMGMFLHMQSNRIGGYYVEFNLTDFASKTMKGVVSEARVYKMASDGSRTHLGTSSSAGIPMPMVKNAWHDIDVIYIKESATFNVYIDGQLRFAFSDSTYTSGNWGTFVRGHTIGVFEYFYAANYDGLPPVAESSFRHKIHGGYVSGFADRETSRRNSKVLNWFFDDFGPWVHEVRRFRVEFDKVPALDAHVYLSNSWDAFITDSNRTAFDAEFWISNAGRDNAVLSGDDPTVYVGGGDIKQQLLMYGQLLVPDDTNTVESNVDGDYRSDEDEENTLTYSNKYAMRKRGVVELTIDSKWLQSKSQAEALGKWITDHWGSPVDNVIVKGFFNPALQLGDVVTISHIERSMTPENHRYHVVGITSNFDGGINMSLQLRRIV